MNGYAFLMPLVIRHKTLLVSTEQKPITDSKMIKKNQSKPLQKKSTPKKFSKKEETKEETIRKQ